jgi:hypothetical protein
MVTVFNLQRQGASESLLYETRQIFSFLLKMDIRLQITHVPGVENVTADALSRMDVAGDYELKLEFYQRGVHFLRINPSLDLFATANNNKCQTFLALPGRRATGARALDALRYSWDGQTVYAFPPVQLIPKVLQRIRMERLQHVVMVFPEWPSRPWWNSLQELVVTQVRLGDAQMVLAPGPTMADNRAKLPPGNILMAHLSCRQ